MLRHKETIEPMLRRAASLEIDASIPLLQVAEKIVALVAGETHA